LRNDFELQLDNYKKYITEDDILIQEIQDILDYDFFVEVCTKLNLVVNKNNYLKCKELFKNRSQL
jgi:hypothetical protein